MQVILCTDGLANRGIGSLDGRLILHVFIKVNTTVIISDPEHIENSIAYYKKLGVSAKESR